MTTGGRAESALGVADALPEPDGVGDVGDPGMAEVAADGTNGRALVRGAEGKSNKRSCEGTLKKPYLQSMR